MVPRSNVPSLIAPFALVGAAAGWLTAEFLSNPLIRVSERGVEWLMAVTSAVVAGVVGAALTRWCAAPPEDTPPNEFDYDQSPRRKAALGIWSRLVLSVMTGGALVGGGVTAVVDGDLRFVPPSVILGAVCSLAFVPVCALVLAAARRADRARLGSLVAGSDRRAVWAILVSALAVAAGAAVIDWPFTTVIGSTVIGAQYRLPAPWPAIAMLLASVALLAFVLYADWAALRQVLRTAATVAINQHASSENVVDVPRLDLGLGDELHAEIAEGSADYRRRARPTALLLGSRAEALAALRRAVLRNVVGLVVAAVVLGAHGYAAWKLRCVFPHRPPFEILQCSES